MKQAYRAIGATLSALLLMGATVPPAGAVQINRMTAVGSLVNDSLYRPNPECGTYLGVNKDGVYEFQITIPADAENQPTPLVPDHYYTKHEITNTDVLKSRAQYFYGIKPGTSDFLCYASETVDGEYTLKAIVHVTVLSKADYANQGGQDNEKDDSTGGNSNGDSQTCTQHTWSYVTKEATCEREGAYSRVCRNCGKEEVISTTSKREHKYTAVVTKQATATTTGIRTYTCINCGNSYSEIISKLSGGQDSEVVKDPNAQAIVSNNQSKQNYSSYYSKPVTSYLYERSDGGFTRVEAVNNKVIVENYDSKMQLLTSNNMPMELNLFGGFYSGADCNFLIFGQKNPSESDAQEIIRVVKYSKNWKRISSASLKGANTYIPFDAGSLRCAESNGMLYILTCHEMYMTSDGYHHQSNMLINIRESDMMITDSRYGISNISTGYVSHSFNQFLIVDSTGRLVALDHGDAYPRAAVLCQYNTSAGSEQISRSVNTGNVVTFSGEVGENATNASLGGLAEATGKYLTVLNTAPQNGRANYQSVRNVVLGITDQKNLSNTKTIQLTNYAQGGNTSASTPQIVKLNDNRFLILWEVYAKAQYGGYTNNGTIGYVIVDREGQTQVQVQTAKGSLSDCQPIEASGQAVWYVTNNSAPQFYTINRSGALQTVNVNNTGVGTSGKDTTPDNSSDTIGTTQTPISNNISGATGNPETPNTSAGQDAVTKPDDQTNAGSQNPNSQGQNGSKPRFRDVSESAYYYNAVEWAVKEQITGGTTANTFTPNAACSRAELVTFLWRAAGKPQANIQNNPFRDVRKDSYYFNAVLWAYESGITGGTSPDMFSPNATVTRGQTAAFLYRASGSPVVDSKAGFTDIRGDEYYADAAAWAEKHNITSGVGYAQFNPRGKCTRAQIVTFLYRRQNL